MGVVMFEIPPMQSWEGLHPLIVHIPIGLLLCVPFLIMLGLVAQKNKETFYLIAFLLLLVGTIGTIFAVATGEAAAKVADTTIGNSKAILEEHEELAEATRNIYIIFTLLYSAFLFLPRILKKTMSNKLHLIGNIAFAVIFCLGILALVNTAHYGGRLVHEFGIKSVIKGTSGQQPTPVQIKPDND